MKKKVFATLLGVLALVSCGTDKKASEQKEDSKIEASIFAIHLGKALDPELPVFKKASEDTGVYLKNVASKNETDQIKAYNLMLAQRPLPDIISYELPDQLESLGIEGGLLPLEKLIDENAPNLKKFFAENPRYKKDATSLDGHIYMIPNYYDWYNLSVSQAYFIRHDWLKKLNLEVPTTPDELYNVLSAFREKDPNGNGKKDEVPYFVRGNNARKVLLALVDIWKVGVTWEESNGKVVYGPAQENYKVAMRNLAKWYKEGLIDKEVFTRGLKARDYLLGNDLGGATNDWVGSSSAYNKKLADKIPGFDFSIMLPPVYNGDKTTKISRPTYLGGWSISVDAKNPVKLIKYFDYWYTNEGRRLWNFGIEGEEYQLVDGKPQFTDKVLHNKDNKSPLDVVRESGAQYRLGMFQDANYEFGWMEPEAKAGNKLYQDNKVVKEQLPVLKTTKDKLKEMSSIDAKLRAYIEQKSQEWILGTSDVDKDWDSYIERLNQLGLQKAMEIQQEAYDRFMNAK